MFRIHKISIFLSFLIAFYFVQFVDSLRCLTCVTPKDCQVPELVECTTIASEETIHHLEGYLQPFPSSRNNTFHCVDISYTKQNSLVIASLRGCLDTDIMPCEFELQAIYFEYNWIQSQCAICNEPFCGKNTGGTFNSKLYIVMTTVFALLLAKLCG